MSNPTIITNENIHDLLQTYINDKSSLPPDLANILIGDWDVSNVTDMSDLFLYDEDEEGNGSYFIEPFNEPLNNWNVSNVTNMEGMFFKCNTFNQPLNNWNVSKVTNMNNMFNCCYDFNQSLDKWNVSNVTDMDGMFFFCRKFNQPLNDWNVSKVTNMRGMFGYCRTFNQPLNDWNVSNVTNMSEMFYSCTIFNQPLNTIFNQPLNKWDVSNVTNMEKMFYSCTSFNQPLNDWNVSNVTNMERMFLGSTSFNQPLNKWDVSNVTNMEKMFFKCPIEERYKPGVIEEPEPEPLSDEDMLKLKELMDTIKVFDVLSYENISATQFMEENKDSKPFIIRNSAGQYDGDAIRWPAPSSSGKEFIECIDTTPVSWQGNSYRQFIKPGGRKFIKINVSGSPTMVVKPDWYDSGAIPGTKFFQIVTTNQPVFKFMTTVLSNQNLPEDYSALGSDHCNQTSPVGVYTLEPITVEQLSSYVTSGGKRKRLTKKNKTKKNKKTVIRKKKNIISVKK